MLHTLSFVSDSRICVPEKIRKTKFDSYTDPSPALQLCQTAQAYYGARNLSTRVLPASLTSVSECMALAGADHITISPPLLRELGSTPLELDQAGQPVGFKSIFDAPYSEAGVQEAKDLNLVRFEHPERWQMCFTRSEDGKPAKKLIDAINIFCDMQLKIEALVKKYLDPNLETVDPKKEKSKTARKYSKQETSNVIRYAPDPERITSKTKRKKPAPAMSTESPDKSEKSSLETSPKIRWTWFRKRERQSLPEPAIEKLV